MCEREQIGHSARCQIVEEVVGPKVKNYFQELQKLLYHSTLMHSSNSYWAITATTAVFTTVKNICNSGRKSPYDLQNQPQQQHPQQLEISITTTTPRAKS